MNWIFKRRINLEAVRLADVARRDALKAERVKTDEMEQAVNGLLDTLLLRGLHNEN
jgi:hypothetical protein